MKMYLIPLFQAGLYPLLVCGLTILVLALVLRGRDFRLDWVAGLGLTVGYCVGFWIIKGFPPVPPVDVLDWLPLMAITGFVTFLFFDFLPRSVRACLVPLLCGLFTWLLLAPLAQQWGTGQILLTSLVLGGLWAILWLVWVWPSTRENSESLVFMIVGALACSLVSVRDGSALLGQLGGVLASASGGLLLLTLVFKNIKASTLTHAVFVVLIGGMLINAYIYAQVSWLAVMLAYLSALSFCLTRFSFYTRWTRGWRLFFVALVSVIPVLIALIYLMSLAAGDDYSY